MKHEMARHDYNMQAAPIAAIKSCGLEFEGAEKNLEEERRGRETERKMNKNNLVKQM